MDSIDDIEISDQIIPDFIHNTIGYLICGPKFMEDNDDQILSLSSIAFIIPAGYAFLYDYPFLGILNTIFTLTYVNYWNRPWCCITETFYYSITVVSLAIYLSIFLMMPITVIEIAPVALLSGFCLYRKTISAERNNVDDWIVYTQGLYALYITFQILCMYNVILADTSHIE